MKTTLATTRCRPRHYVLLLIAATLPAIATDPSREPSTHRIVWQAFHRGLTPPQRAALKADTATDVLGALMQLHAPVARAVQALAQDRPHQALDALETPAATDPFLLAHHHWLRARALIAAEDYERAAAELAGAEARIDFLQQPDEILLHRAMLLALTLQRHQAVDAFTTYLRIYPHAPPARRHAAAAMREDLARFAPDSPAEVADLLNFARRRLKLGDPGAITQTRQQQALDALDTIIREEEKRQQQQQQQQQQAGQGNQPGQPAQVSQLQEGQGPDSAAGNRPRRTANPWGDLPEHTRKRIVNTLQQRFPERYRTLLEQYFRSLRETDPE